jgi:hypothetical protein
LQSLKALLAASPFDHTVRTTQILGEYVQSVLRHHVQNGVLSESQENLVWMIHRVRQPGRGGTGDWKRREGEGEGENRGELLGT